MCNPVAIALSLTAAGSAAQSAGARRAAKAMEGARVAEGIRQKGFQDEAGKVVDQSLDQSGRASTDASMKAAADARAADAAAAVADVRKPIEATGANLSGDQAANRVMATESDLQAAKNLGYAGQQGAAKANLLSFNDLTFQNAINNIRAGQQLNTVGNFMRGSAGVLPSEIEAASRKGDNLKTFGTLLNTAGTIVGMGAGAGWWDKVDDVAGAGAGATAGGAAGTTPVVAKPVDVSNLKVIPGSIRPGSITPFGTPGQLNLDDWMFNYKYGNVLRPNNSNLFGAPWSKALETPIK